MPAEDGRAQAALPVAILGYAAAHLAREEAAVTGGVPLAPLPAGLLVVGLVILL